MNGFYLEHFVLNPLQSQVTYLMMTHRFHIRPTIQNILFKACKNDITLLSIWHCPFIGNHVLCVVFSHSGGHISIVSWYKHQCAWLNTINAASFDHRLSGLWGLVNSCSCRPICTLTICALIYMGLNMDEQVPVLTYLYNRHKTSS